MKLAAIIITRNEEANIARCLESVSFCDEIIVVDAESRDRTCEIAMRYTAQVHTLPWRGYAEQKNAAVTHTHCEWVLSVDADEEVSSELRAEIQSVVSGNPRQVAFSVPRKTIHFGRWIRHGGWYPNRLIRLFRKDAGEWVGAEVHERWEARGEVGELQSDLLHYSFKDLADQVARNNRYSSLSAIRLRKEGKSFSSAKLFLKSVSKFMETYFLKKGFLDGYPGFIISVSASYSVFLKWAKLWELENESEKI